MRKILRFGVVFGIFAAIIGNTDSFAAKRASAKKQSAISIGTKVRGKTEAVGIYDQECYDAYYGCMDQFCIVDNEIGASGYRRISVNAYNRVFGILTVSTRAS